MILFWLVCWVFKLYVEDRVRGRKQERVGIKWMEGRNARGGMEIGNGIGK